MARGHQRHASGFWSTPSAKIRRLPLRNSSRRSNRWHRGSTGHAGRRLGPACERLATCAADAAAHFAGSRSRGSPRAKPSFWARALARQCADLRDELLFLAPWLELRTSPGTGPGTSGRRTVSRRCASSRRSTRHRRRSVEREATRRPRPRRARRARRRCSRSSRKAASARRQEWPPSTSLRCRRPRLPQWTTTSCSTRCAGSW